jgi:thiol-disulfide isomerase/thioredoxin
MVVYFWAGWCPYCQALDSKYLPTAPVQEYLREVIKVRIYPEQGPAERELARQYNVRGYPSFFIIRNASAKPKKVHPFRGSRNWTPEQFAAACQKAGPIPPNGVANRGSEGTGQIIEPRPDTKTPAVNKTRITSGGGQIVTVVPTVKTSPN